MGMLAGLFGGGGGAAAGAGAAGTAATAAPSLAAAAPAAGLAAETAIGAGAAPFASAAAPGAEAILGGAGLPVSPALSVPGGGTAAAATSEGSWLSSLGRGAKDLAGGYTGIGGQPTSTAGQFGASLQNLQQQGQSGETNTPPPLVPYPRQQLPDPLTILQAFGLQS